MFNISFGVGNSLTRNENSYATFNDMVNDSDLQTDLAFDPAQVDVRVNGSVVNMGDSPRAGMRVELIRRAGRKSDGFMNTDEQLKPIGISTEIQIAVSDVAESAIAPFYQKVNDAEKAAEQKRVAAQRELLKDFKPFNELVDSLSDQLVRDNYLSNIGTINIPNALREELDLVATTIEETLADVRKELQDAEKAVNLWKRATKADLHMCVTVAEQRAVLAKVLGSNPLETWVFSGRFDFTA
jgi:hypothetical protein